MTDPMVSFDEPALAAAVEQLTPQEIDTLPCGANRLDPKGVVTYYSKGEARLSGYGSRPALGRSFFTQIAPCMDNELYRGRIDQAIAAGRLDIEFGYVGDFSDADRELRVRVQSASDGGYWIFMQRVA